jgi:hypothetical protein
MKPLKWVTLWNSLQIIQFLLEKDRVGQK